MGEDIVGLGDVSFFERGGVGHHGHGGLGDGAVFAGLADDDVVGLGCAGGGIGEFDDDGFTGFYGETVHFLAIGIGVEELEFVGIDDDDLGVFVLLGEGDSREGEGGGNEENGLFDHGSWLLTELRRCVLLLGWREGQVYSICGGSQRVFGGGRGLEFLGLGESILTVKSFSI